MNNYGNASEGLQKMFIAQVCLYHMQRAVCHSDHQYAGNCCLDCPINHLSGRTL